MTAKTVDISDDVAAARAFLEAMGSPPWRILAGDVVREVNPKTPKVWDTLAKLMRVCADRRMPVKVYLPREEEDQVKHLAISSPPDADASRLPFAASLVVKGAEHVRIWKLDAPLSASRAQAISHRYAAKLHKHAKACVGDPVPLPGSEMHVKTGWRRSLLFKVHAMAPAKYAYRLVDDQLAGPAKVAVAKAFDPAALNVPVGDSDSGPVIWTPGQLANGFQLVLGGSGAGKTFTLRQLAASIHRYGVPVLIFDFHGDVQVPGIRDELLSSGTDSVRGLNPMELDGACARQSGLYDQRGSLQEMITRACPMLGHRQRNALRLAMEQVYAQAGIMDNEPSTWSNPAPTFADLLGIIEDEGLRAGAAELFGHPIFKKREHISVGSFSEASMRLDLSKLSDGCRFIATESLLQRLFRMLRMQGSIPLQPASDRERFRLFVVIDEVQILSLGGGVNVLDTLFREARKFGLGMILGTQSASNLTKDVRANASAWLTLLHNEMDEAKKTAPNIGVEPEALMKLKGKGDGYYRAGTEAARRVQVRAG